MDRILLAHRNLKLFLFATTGPALVLTKLISWTLKFLAFYFLYQTGLKGKEDSKTENNPQKVDNAQTVVYGQRIGLVPSVLRKKRV